MPGASSYSMTASDLTFAELIKLFARRKWIIIVNALIFLALAAAFSFFSKPVWQKEVRILLEGRTQGNTGVSGDPILDAVINQQGIIDVPTGMEILQQQDIYVETLNRAGIPIPRRDQMEDAPRITIEQIGISNAIMVTIRARSEEDANAIARWLPEVYEEEIAERLQDPVRSAISVVSSDVTEAEDAVEKAEQALIDYQKENQVVSPTIEIPLRIQAEQEAERRLRDAQADVASAELRLDSLEASLDSTPAEISEQFEEPNREQLEAARQLLDELLAEKQAALASYKPGNPVIKQLDARIEAQRQRIERLPKTIARTMKRPNPLLDVMKQKVADARADLQAARAVERRLEAITPSVSNDVSEVITTQGEQQKLERDIEEAQKTLDLKRDLLDKLHLKDNEIREPVQNISQMGDAEQTSPRWVINLILGLVLGLVVGAMVAIGRDLALDRVNYPVEAAGIAGAEVLARVPKRARARHPLIRDPQKARAFESYRQLRAGVLMGLRGRGDNALLVSSTKEGEGKTVVAGNLAVAMVLDGRRTVLVDGNLRSPKVDRLFSASSEHGLTDVLLGKVGTDGALVETEVEGLFLLTAGSALANPTEALGSPAMQGLLEELRAKFDVVIVDAPQASVTADTHELTRSVKNILYVVELEKANKTLMEESIAMLRQVGGHILGIVLNKDPSAKERIS